jgi:hypothetical protein
MTSVARGVPDTLYCNYMFDRGACNIAYHVYCCPGNLPFLPRCLAVIPNPTFLREATSIPLRLVLDDLLPSLDTVQQSTDGYSHKAVL